MKRTVITTTVCLFTVVAVVVFVRTIVKAAFHVDDSGTLSENSAVEFPIRKIATSTGDADSAKKGGIANEKGMINPRYPSKLIIPALNINANVQLVGTKTDGSMGTPSNFTDVAWYAYGTIPGDKGSAVIDGHVDNGLGLRGVFKDLDQLRTGDEISVVNRSGQRLVFKVTSLDLYRYDATPNSQLFSDDSGYYLKLVTCEGKWVSEANTYSERLLVTAELTNNNQ